MNLKDGNIPGTFNGVIENTYYYGGQKNYMKYTVVGSTIASHVEIKGKQILQTTRGDFTMGPMSGDMPDSDTIMAVGCGRLHTMKRVSETQQSAHADLRIRNREGGRTVPFLNFWINEVNAAR